MNFGRDECLDVPSGVRVDASRVSHLFRQVMAPAAFGAAHR
jgi:hypothetical protein